MRAEGRLSAQDFVDKIEENKDRLEETLHETSVMLDTKKIIQERVSMLTSIVKKRRKVKNEKDNKGRRKKAKTDSTSG